MNLSRSEDKKALVGTITVYLLLILLLILMSMFNACSDVAAEEINSGGVAVSIGNPDDGGPDNSSAEEETIPQTEEEYTPENQLTSDVAEAGYYGYLRGRYCFGLLLYIFSGQTQ